MYVWECYASPSSTRYVPDAAEVIKPKIGTSHRRKPNDTRGTKYEPLYTLLNTAHHHGCSHNPFSDASHGSISSHYGQTGGMSVILTSDMRGKNV